MKRRRKKIRKASRSRNNLKLWLLVFFVIGLLSYFVFIYSYQSKPKVVTSPPLPERDTIPPPLPEKRPLPEKAEKETPEKKIVGKIAIVIDDLGQDLEMSRLFLDLDKSLTISILPGLPYSQQIAKEAKNKGHDIILHLPMEPEGYPNINPGKGALLSNMSRDELLKLLREDISSVPHIKGINNHMGSKLTTDEAIMETIFEELKGRNYFFLDSRTDANSKAYQVAKKFGLKAGKRDVFLDNDRKAEEIKKMFSHLENAAIKKGKAVAIGHPYSETLAVLREGLPRLSANGIKLVPLSEIVE